MTSNIPEASHTTSIMLGGLVSTHDSMRSGSVRSIASSMARGMCLGLLLACGNAQLAFAADDVAPWGHQGHSVAAQQGAVTIAPESLSGSPPKRVNFERERPSQDARQVAEWIVDSGDNGNMPFVIVDKKDAKVYVFHADGRLRGAAPALLGLAVGDDSVPGIGDRKLSSIRPDERTTPAGRFVASLDRNLHGGEILWVDYDAAISLHPVITSNLKEHRAQRLATPSPLDNRVSYGCINVPADFFKSVVNAAFTGTNGVVYVLPETRSIGKVFAAYDLNERARLKAAHPGLPVQAESQIDANFAGR